MIAASLLALDIADDPTGWARAGFTVADDAVHLGGVVLRLVGPGERRGVTGWALGGDLGGAVDGLALAQPPSRDLDLLPPSAVRHANGATALDHVVIATPDLERTTAAFTGLGWQPRRTIADPRGVQARTLRFFLVATAAGKVVLELMHDPVGGPARTTFWGLAVTVADLEAARRRLGGDALGDPKDAVQPGRRIATVRGDRIGIGLPLAFLSPRPPPVAKPRANGSMGRHG